VAVPNEMVDAEGHLRLASLVSLAAPSLAPTNGQAKRLVQQGGVSVDGEKITDPAALVTVQTGMIVKVGKSHFARLIAPTSG